MAITREADKFRPAHLDLLKDLNCQEIKTVSGDNYLVPQKNFDSLEQKLGLLSCGVSKGANYPAAEFCLLCPKTAVLRQLYAGESHCATFHEFPADLYDLTITLGLHPEKAEEILHTYLDRWCKDLKSKCAEGFALPEKVNWDITRYGFGADKEKYQIKDIIQELSACLSYLDNLTKGRVIFKPEHSNSYKYRACSTHLKSQEEISQRIIKEVINDFKKDNLELEEKDFEIIFKEEKIFDSL